MLQRSLQRGAAGLDAGVCAQVRTFLRSQWNADGGFRGRSSASDLYYTVFGLECASALPLDLPPGPARSFVASQASLPLDFVHLTCLARCVRILWPEFSRPAWTAQLEPWVQRHACPGGGYHRKPGQPRGSVYESFLGALANEALDHPDPSPPVSGEEGTGQAGPISGPGALSQCLMRLCQPSGGFINGDGLAAASTPVTAAALLLLHELGQPLPDRSVEWLLSRQSASGGFVAAALVPMADLLSTATALHALRCVGALSGVRVEASLEFVTGCWEDPGGFHAHALDRVPDCEYTFYGLLALGSLVA